MQPTLGELRRLAGPELSPDPQPQRGPGTTEVESQVVFARLMLCRRALTAASSGAGAQTTDGDGLPRLSAALIHQLVRAIRASVRRGGKRIEVKLGLRELGGLRLRLELHGQRVLLWVSVPDARVAWQIMNSRNELAQALARWGLELGGLQARCRGQHEEPDEGEQSDGDGSDADEATGPSRQPATAGAPDRRSFIEVVV
jgi:hypothetical protein